MSWEKDNSRLVKEIFRQRSCQTVKVSQFNDDGTFEGETVDQRMISRCKFSSGKLPINSWVQIERVGTYWITVGHAGNETLPVIELT